MSNAREPINVPAMEECFPQVLAGFGAAALRRQIVAYNAMLAEGLPEEESATNVAARLVRGGISSPHVSLLNLVSLWSASPNSVESRGLVGRLLLLENALATLDRHGVAATNYGSMLRDPEGLEQLIAELDAASVLTRLGRLDAHSTSAGSGTSKKNYDIDWTLGRVRLRADVKWFQTSALNRALEDELSGLLTLLRSDVEHMVYVSLERRPYSDTMLVRAAVEVLDLYQAAIGGKAVPGIDVSCTNDDGVVVVLRDRVPHPGVSVIAGVREITVYVSDGVDPGGAPFLVSLCGTGSSARDVNTVRRCLQDGASQVPRANSSRDLSAIAVGSINPKDVLDVRLALYGQNKIDPTTGASAREPGLFSDDTEEVDLKHIDAVVFFSLRYVPRGRRVVVKRVVQVFARDKLGWRRRLMLLLWRWLFRRPRRLPAYRRATP